MSEHQDRKPRIAKEKPLEDLDLLERYRTAWKLRQCVGRNQIARFLGDTQAVRHRCISD